MHHVTGHLVDEANKCICDYSGFAKNSALLLSMKIKMREETARKDGEDCESRLEELRAEFF